MAVSVLVLVEVSLSSAKQHSVLGAYAGVLFARQVEEAPAVEVSKRPFHATKATFLVGGSGAVAVVSSLSWDGDGHAAILAAL